MIADLTGIAKKLFNATVTQWSRSGEAGSTECFVGVDAANIEVELYVSEQKGLIRAVYNSTPRKVFTLEFSDLPGLTNTHLH